VPVGQVVSLREVTARLRAITHASRALLRSKSDITAACSHILHAVGGVKGLF
jgi:hypothetical protein